VVPRTEFDPVEFVADPGPLTDVCPLKLFRELFTPGFIELAGLLIPIEGET